MKKILIPTLLTIASAPLISLVGCRNGTIPTGITISKTSLNLAVGGTTKLTATVTPINASQEVEWSSSDLGVCSVNNGIVKALAVGKATITVTAKNSDITATCEVNVTATMSVTVNQYNSYFSEGWGCMMTESKEIYPSNQNYLFDITYDVQDEFYKGLAYMLSIATNSYDKSSDQFTAIIGKIYVNDESNVVQDTYYAFYGNFVWINNKACPQMLNLKNGDHIFIELNISNIQQKEYYWVFSGWSY
ncbi:MAG: Ig-like domain-containing protein [Mycoplasma sp.]|nr:Ig-like domain-containing protein [Candidatus Hennigella equi]